MNTKPHQAIAALESMRLPELQARYLEVLGTTTRCPNRGYLVRKIAEALAANDQDRPAAAIVAQVPDLEPPPHEEVEGNIAELLAAENTQAEGFDKPDREEVESLDDGDLVPAEPSGDMVPVTNATARARGRFRGMTVEELQHKFVEVVGRPSGSSHAGYVELRNMWSCYSSRFDRPANTASGPHHILGAPRRECP